MNGNFRDPFKVKGLFPSFDKKLHDEIYKKREEIAIRKILEGEFPERELAKVYGYTPVPAMPLPSPSSIPAGTITGQLISAGVGAALAPLLLGAFEKGKISGALKLLSIPIAALGGATLYTLLSGGTKQEPQFKPAYPMIEKGLL